MLFCCAGGAQEQSSADQRGMHAGGIQARRRAPPLSAGLHQHCGQLLPPRGPAQNGIPGAADPGIPYQRPHPQHLPVTVPTGDAVIPKVPRPCCFPHSECLYCCCCSMSWILGFGSNPTVKAKSCMKRYITRVSYTYMPASRLLQICTVTVLGVLQAGPSCLHFQA